MSVGYHNYQNSTEFFKEGEPLWRKKEPLDEDFFKKYLNEFKNKLDEQNFKELREAQQRLIDKDNQVLTLKEELKMQSEMMGKLQVDINNLITIYQKDNKQC